MTDTFTIEDLNRARDKAHQMSNSDSTSSDIWDDMIAELTKSQWKPQGQEVYAFRSIGSTSWRFIEHIITSSFNSDTERRPLTPDEVPAWKRDKEALKVAIDILDGFAHLLSEKDRETFAKIKELTAANEDMK